MTDVIGWGDEHVGEDVGGPSRRRLRLPRGRAGFAWGLVVVIVAIAALWPYTEQWFADRAARHLRDVWSRVDALDSERSDAIAPVLQAAGPFDQLKVLTAIQLIDLEEIDRLIPLRKDLDGMQTWAGDVKRTRDAMVAAITADITGLRREARSHFVIDLNGEVPVPFNEAEAAVHATAEADYATLQQMHHLGPLPSPVVHLSAAADILRLLQRPTDEPTGLTLVTATNDGAVEITNLDTGVSDRRTVMFDPSAGGGVQVQIVGRSALVSNSDVNYFLPLSLNGGVIKGPPGQPLSTVGHDVWLVQYGAVQQVDDHGRRVGPSIADVLDRLELGSFGGNDTAIAAIRPDITEPVVMVDPLRRRQQAVRITGCEQGIAAALHSFALAVAPICHDPGEAIDLVRDDGTVSARIPFPDRLTSDDGRYPAMSADGSRVAIPLSASADDWNQGITTKLGILDVRTRHWTVLDVGQDWSPASWSPDGTTLLLTSSAGTEAGAIWRVGDTQLESLRVPTGISAVLVRPAS